MMQSNSRTRDRPIRVLVTGASGYIGRHVVVALLDSGAEVIAVDRGEGPRLGLVDSRATVITADIFDGGGDLFAQLNEPDVCIHLAWEAGFVHNDPVHMLRLSQHYRFLTGLVAGGLRQLVVLGTMHEIGYFEGAIDEHTPAAPLSLYGVAKNSLREALFVALREQDVTLQWLRCFYISGDDEHSNSIFTKIAQAEARGDVSFPFTTGSNRFDFIDVRELATQIAASALQIEVSGIINCCSGEPMGLGDRAEKYISDRNFQIALDYGRYPDRAYDSPGVWGESTKIRQILARANSAGKS